MKGFLKKSYLGPVLELMAAPPPPSHGYVIAFQVLGNQVAFTSSCSVLQSHSYDLRCFFPQFLTKKKCSFRKMNSLNNQVSHFDFSGWFYNFLKRVVKLRPVTWCLEFMTTMTYN